MTKDNLTIKDLTRRQIRYICFRLQTQTDGGAKVDPAEGDIMELVYEIKDHMESQEDFGGWAKFARTWDVDEKAPLVAVIRTHSIQTEWNKILKEETKVIPAQIQEEIQPKKLAIKKKKFLVNKLGQEIQEVKQEQAALTPVEVSHKKGFWERFN